LDAQRKREAQEELEQLGRRRLEREKEMMLREEEEARMSRLAESAQMADWLAKEHQFNLDQERNRATIRIREKRAKAVDFLCFNLRYIDPSADDGNGWSSADVGDLEIDLEEPYTIFEVCTPSMIPLLLQFSRVESIISADSRAARRHTKVPVARVRTGQRRFLDEYDGYLSRPTGSHEANCLSNLRKVECRSRHRPPSRW
jgi:hypothetical protein